MGHDDPTDDPVAWPALDALVSTLIDTRRRVAALQAAEARLLAGATDLVIARTAERHAENRSNADLPLREVALELAMAMRASDRTVQGRMGDAAVLVGRLPRTLDAWEAGRIDAPHVWAIVRAGMAIGDAERLARYEELALAAAETESPGRLVPIVRALAAAVDPDTFQDRLTCAADDRSVRVYDLDEGMARLIADLPAPLAYGIRDRLTEMAQAVLGREGMGEEDRAGAADGPADAGGVAAAADRRGSAPACVCTGPGIRRLPVPGDDSRADTRTVDQARADVLADLLLGGIPVAHGADLGSIRARIQVTVPALTLAGVGTEPALLVGYGPIDPELARRLAFAAPGWDRVFTDPHTGAVLAVDRYRPSAELRRYHAARDERCRTPGCRRAAHRCDLDHTVDAALGGPTAVGNLAMFCRRHHTDKHATAWRVRQLPGGVIEWTAPTGRRYRDRPPATVRFVPEPVPADQDPPPF